MMLLSLRLMVFGVVVAEDGGWVAWEACEDEAEILTLLVFNPDKMSLMSLGPFISGLPLAKDCLVGSREAWGLCGGGGGMV